MELIIELILQFIAELFLQVFAELLLGFGFKGLRPAGRSDGDADAAFAAIGFSGFGALLGWFSLLKFPQHFIRSQGLQVFNLVATPFLCGFLYSGLTRDKDRPEEFYVKFVNGLLFAFFMALIRFWMAE